MRDKYPADVGSDSETPTLEAPEALIRDIGTGGAADSGGRGADPQVTKSRAARFRRFLAASPLLFSACVTDPSGGQIKELVSLENIRGTSEADIGRKPAEDVGVSREERLENLRGKEITAYIHGMRGKRGLALAGNVEVYVDDCEIGDKVKIRIATSSSGAGIGEIVRRMGNARRSPQAGGILEGQVYLIEIVGRTPAGDYYGLIGEQKAYVLGARKTGEILRAVVMGTDSLIGGEEVIYMKKSKGNR